MQAEGQVVSTRPVSKNRIWEGSAAMADTIRGSPGRRHSFPQRQSRDHTFHNTFIAPDIIIFNLYPAGQHQSDIVDDISGMKDGLTFVIIPFLCAKTLEQTLISSGGTSLNKGAFSNSL